MTPRRAATLVLLEALEADRSPPSLRAIDRRAAAQLERGSLEGALRSLDADEGLAQVCSLWPKAGRAALRRLDLLPSRAHLTARVAQTLGYLALLLGVQLVVLAVLRAKVLPILSAMQTDLHREFDPLPLVVAVCALASVPLLAWAGLGAAGWSRLPGWGRELLRAKEAALAAALAERAAPEDVRAVAHRRFRTLNQPDVGSLEFDELFHASRARGEQKLSRFLVSLRVVGITFASLIGLATLVSVYGTIARLSWP